MRSATGILMAEGRVSGKGNKGGWAALTPWRGLSITPDPRGTPDTHLLLIF